MDNYLSIWNKISLKSDLSKQKYFLELGRLVLMSPLEFWVFGFFFFLVSPSFIIKLCMRPKPSMMAVLSLNPLCSDEDPDVFLQGVSDRLLLVIKNYLLNLTLISLMNVDSPAERRAQGEPNILILSLWTSTYSVLGSGALWCSHSGIVLSPGT